ncbi:hypothetical protein ACFLTP_10605 [Chloroflexota bacterium]
MADGLGSLIQRGLLLPLQALLLIIDGYFIIAEEINSWILLSSIFVLSIFVLQSVRVRFLWLYPYNKFVDRPSPEIDTYYLRVIIILATLVTVLGIPTALDYHLDLWWDKDFIACLPIIGIILVVVVPALFWIFSKYMNKRIANKLRSKGPNLKVTNCLQCHKNSHEEKREIIDQHMGSITMSCINCHYQSMKYLVPLNVGN